MKLSDKLDEITRKFWSTWRTWRLGQGWALGTDLPSQKVSPHLVASFDQLTPEGSDWFRAHTALLLHAIGDMAVETPAPAAPVADPAMPRLRAEIDKHRTDTNGLLLQISQLQLALDQETQKTDIERELRNEAEAKLTKIEPVIAELKATVLPTTKAVETALDALKSGDQQKVAASLAEALAFLTGESVEAPAPKAETAPKPKKKKPAKWG